MRDYVFIFLDEYLKKSNSTDAIVIFNGFCNYLWEKSNYCLNEDEAHFVFITICRQRKADFPVRKGIK